MILLLFGLALIWYSCKLVVANESAGHVPVTAPAVAFQRIGYRLLQNYSNPFMELDSFGKMVVDNVIPYSCGGWETKYSEVNIFGHTPEDHDGFQAHKFLSLMRNKQLAMVGDSLTRQYFVALLNELRPLVTKMTYQHRNEELPLTYTMKSMFFTHFHQFRFQVASYNASFLFCFNSLLYGDFTGHETNSDGLEAQTCNNLMLDADYLVIGVAAWFKPFWLNAEMMKSRGASYYVAMDYNLRSYSEAIRRVRQQLATARPNMKVFWRGCPHAGDVDYFIWKYPNDSYSHFNSKLWNNMSRSAIWPEVIDSVSYQVALQYDDVMLDFYTLSLLYLEHYDRVLDSTLHPDSLHFCQASVSRGALFFLQQAIVFVEGKSEYYPAYLPRSPDLQSKSLRHNVKTLQYLKPTVIPHHVHTSHPGYHAHVLDTISGHIHRHHHLRQHVPRQPIVSVREMNITNPDDPMLLSPEYAMLLRKHPL